MQAIIKRILTAVLLLPPVLIVIIKASSLWFFLATLFIVILLSNEWSNLFKFNPSLKLIFLTINVFFGILFNFILFNPLLYSTVFLGINLLLWLLMICSVIYYNKYALVFNAELFRFRTQRLSLLSLLIGVIILVSFWLSLVHIRAYQNNYLFLICLLCMVWSVDTGAYFFGKFFGKHKLIKNVSPGKTVEGVIGGLFAIILLNSWFYYSLTLFNQHVSLLAWVFVTFMIYIFAVFGDLVESMFKRIMDVKDSGSLLPGHGGVLDRLDSLISTAPMYYLLLNYFYL